MVLVTGGRGFTDAAGLTKILDRARAQFPDLELVLGGATGADELARLWAHANEVNYHVYPAKWNTRGKSAGPIRNQEMLDREGPRFVAAFPGGRGTADMVKRARAAKIPVYCWRGHD